MDSSLFFDGIHHDDLETIEQRDSVRIVRIKWDAVALRQQADLLKRLKKPSKG